MIMLLKCKFCSSVFQNENESFLKSHILEAHLSEVIQRLFPDNDTEMKKEKQ